MQGCSSTVLEAIDRASITRSLEPGVVLCHEGAPGREAFLILEGEVVVEIGGIEVARVGRGSFVGEMALLDRKPRTATVTAVTPLTALVFSIREFQAIVRDAPALSRRLSAELSERLRATQQSAAAGR